MANTIEIILTAIDKASDIILGVEKKATASNVAIAKSFEGVGISSDAVDKKLGEYGAALDKTSIAQNKLKQAQFEAQEAAQKLAQAQYNLSKNTDPSKLDALNKELVDAQVNLDGAGKKVQDLSKDLRDGKAAAEGTASGFGKMQAGIVVANQAFDLLGRGINTAKEILDQTVGSTMAYAKEVRDLSTNLGITTEETSKIIQASDDYGISVGEVTSALQMAVRRGFAPNIETLAKLADEYNNIADPTERAARLTDVFGRNWTALTPMLKEGGQAIRDAAGEAEKLGLVLSEKDTKASRDLEIQIDNLNDRVEALKLKIGKGLVPDLANSASNLVKLISVLDGTASETEKLQYAIEVATRAYGENSQEVLRAKDILEAYKKMLASIGQTSNETALRANMALVKSFGTVQTSLSDLDRGVRNQAATYAILDAAMDKTTSQSKLLASSQAIIAQEMADLNIGIAGAVDKEMKSYNESQATLQKRLQDTAKELKTLQSEQGRVDKSTTKNAMSAAQLAQAQARLVNTQQQLAKETDPAKQNELAASIAVQQEKISGANQAVVSYVDNSKRIAELKGQYDEINVEIDKNAQAHEEATKRIIYGYAEQQLAIGGFTETEAKALDLLAVRLGLKSSEDVKAFQAIRDAASNLAKDSDIYKFTDAVDEARTHTQATQRALDEAAKAHITPFALPVDEAAVKANTDKVVHGIDEAAKAHGAVVKEVAAKPIVETVTADAKKAKSQLTDFSSGKEVKEAQKTIDKKITADTRTATSNVQTLQRSGIDPLTQAWYGLNQQISTFLTLIGAVPPTVTPPTITPPGGGGGGSCFIAGTLITLEDYSSKRIEDVRIDDVVLSFNELGGLVEGIVTDTTESATRELYEITFWNSVLICTADHPFYAPQIGRLDVEYVHGGFVRAKDIQPGDWIESLLGGQKVLTVTRKDVDTTPVYNFNVAGTHTYIANGVLVHNIKIGKNGISDYIVPPNPRGGSSDYYPVLAAPGERVNVTPAGQRGNGGALPAINITQNFSGAQSEPERYKSLMYEVITDVIEQAMRQ